MAGDDDSGSAALARTECPGTATLHEAFGRRGALPSVLKPLERTMRINGPALPVRCPPGDNLWIHRAMAEAKPGDVLVVECGTGDEFGYWGGIMATSAVALGLGGLVITGGVRDSLELLDLGFPTFSSRICIQGTGKDPHGDGAVGEPVRIGDVTVRRGDIVVGDADGLVVLPAAQADQIMAAGHDRDAKEAAIIERVLAGELTLDVYNL